MHIVGYRFSTDSKVTIVRDDGGIEPLPLRLDLWNHSPTGFGWGYRGSGPAQLALAILAQVTGDDVYARGRHQQFKEQVVARLQEISWDISAEEVRAWATSHPLLEAERFMWMPARQRAEAMDRPIAEQQTCEVCKSPCRYECTKEPEPYRPFVVCIICGHRAEF